MLAQVHIKDFAIIDEVSADLRAGFTVFTGETGAGKSILVEALGLALGDRAESVMVRSGAQRASVTAVFEIKPGGVLAEFLAAQGLDSDTDEIILRRQIEADGKSRGFCNGTPVTVQTLRELGEHLVDVHGQHAHYSLVRRDSQRQLLDDYGNYTALLDKLAQAYRQWKATQEQLHALSRTHPEERARDIELLGFQVRELEDLKPRTDELQRLDSEHRRLANVAKIIEICTRIQQHLADSEISAESLLTTASKEAGALVQLDARLQPIADLLSQAQTAVTEASSEVRHYLLDLDSDPHSLDALEERLGALHDVARKHHTSVEQLDDLLQALRQRLVQLEAYEEHLAQLETELSRHHDGYRSAALQLSQQRCQTAKRLSAEIARQLQELGMPGGQFEISVGYSASAQPTPYGNDSVDFLVSANPGQPLRPLAKVASGGELSRISLAIQVVAANDKAIPTMVFDEIDVGIGGGIAEILGILMRSLSARCQVLCVTHHAQVAAQAHQHYSVKKQIAGGRTKTGLALLQNEERVSELARMLGGIKVSERAMEHAREMLAATLTPSKRKFRKPAPA